MNKNSKLMKLLLLFLILSISTLFVQKYFKPFLIIIFLIIISSPIKKLLDRMNISNEKIKAIIIIIIINIGMFLFIYSLGNNLYNFINDNFIKEQGKFINAAKLFMDNVYATLGSKIGSLDVGKSGILNKDILTKGAVYTTDGALAYFIANIAVYFILSDKYAILNFVKLLIGDKMYYSVSKKIYNLKQVMVIEIILILFSTLQILIGFFILRIPNGFMLGIICGILDILPFVGTILIFIPLVIYSVIMKNYFVAVGLVSLYIIVEMVRQILETKFISNKLEIHPLAILLSIYIGIKVFGVIGVFTGIVYVVLSKEILTRDMEDTI